MNNHESPHWIELSRKLDNKDFDLYAFHYELILFKTDYSVIFYAKEYQLKPQEYLFLLNILKQNGNRISAEKLMNLVETRGSEELAVKNSYKVKNKIKCKLKEKWDSFLPPYNDVSWMIVGNNKEFKKDKVIIENVDYCINNYQHCDFETAFNYLIKVKKGYYYSEYQRESKLKN